MQTIVKTSLAALILLTATLMATSAFAAMQTLNIQWSGAGFGNKATATGAITFDNTKLPQIGNPGFISLPATSVTSLTITITGAASGNGTYSLTDFYGLNFSTPKALNMSAQLVGQTLANGITFGSLQPNFSAGDFNLFGQSASAPTGGGNFTLVTNQGAGDALSVTSMTPAGAANSSVSVPALSDWATGLFGLALLSIAYYVKGCTKQNR